MSYNLADLRKVPHKVYPLSSLGVTLCNILLIPDPKVAKDIKISCPDTGLLLEQKIDFEELKAHGCSDNSPSGSFVNAHGFRYVRSYEKPRAFGKSLRGGLAVRIYHIASSKLVAFVFRVQGRLAAYVVDKEACLQSDN